MLTVCFCVMQQQQQGGLQSDYETEECEPEPEEELPDEVVDEQPDEELTLSLETDQPIVECGECVWIRGVQIVKKLNPKSNLEWDSIRLLNL